MAVHRDGDSEKLNEVDDCLRVNLSRIDNVDNAHRGLYRGDGTAWEEDDYVHPETSQLFAKFPCLDRIPIFGNSCRCFGVRCTVSLGLVYFLNKGVGYNLINYASLAMFTSRFGVSGERYQRLYSVAKMGFSIKAVSALASDSVALFGYTKRWYCMMACVVGAALTIGFGCLPPEQSSADIAAGLLFLTSFSVANVDILSEGHYSRLMRRHPKAGPSLISWIWWFILSATIVAALIQGPLSDRKLPQIGLFIAGAAQLISVIFFPLNWYGEGTNREEQRADALAMRRDLHRARRERGSLSPSPGTNRGGACIHQESFLCPAVDAVDAAEKNSSNSLTLDRVQNHADMTDDEIEEPIILGLCCNILEVNKDICIRNWRILIYSLIMTFAVVLMTCMTILGTRWQLLYACISVFVVCTASAFWALPLLIAKVSMYFFSYAFLYLRLPGALDSFYTAPKECLPDGPHFSYVFYHTISAVIGNVAGIAAVAAFPYLFSKHSLRYTLMLTYSIQVIASVFDIIMVKRWNLYIGIPDHAMYILGDAIVHEVSYYLAWMPTVVLLSRICPRGSESMVYALVAGFGNLGASMSSLVGSLLMEFKWPITTKGTCDFSNVPMLLLVGHILLPTLIVPLSFLLVPAARICDDIDADGRVIRKEPKPVHRENLVEATEPMSGLSQ